jgi:PAS domain S-box-containing protein
LSARERELSVLIRSVQELLFQTDAAGVLRFVNLRWDPVRQRPAEALIGRSLQELVSPDTREALPALLDADPAVRTRRATVRLDPDTGPGPESRWLDLAVVPVIADGRVTGFAGSGVDVTAQRATQEALQAQLAFTESLIDNNPLPVSVLDTQGRYLLVNRAWEDFTGQRRGVVMGLTPRDILPASEVAVHAAHDRALLEHGQTQRYEVRRTRPDGTVRDLLVSKSLLRDAAGDPSRIVVSLMDITDIREAERVTDHAREVAEKASIAKSEFMANVSHELRTPLQSIIGFSELGRRRAREQDKLAEMFGDIHRAGQRMLSLVNDLLDLARAESAGLAMNFEFHDVRGLVREVVRELRPQAEARPLTVPLSLPAQPLIAGVDPLRFQQVIRNVLANAIRFSPPGEAVELNASARDDGMVVLEVSDRGPGIPPDELERIFDAFVQSSRTKDGSGGTGLGLAISRRIMAAHGGSVSAALREGGGSVFRIAVPGMVFGRPGRRPAAAHPPDMPKTPAPADGRGPSRGPEALDAEI